MTLDHAFVGDAHLGFVLLDGFRMLAFFALLYERAFVFGIAAYPSVLR